MAIKNDDSKNQIYNRVAYYLDAIHYRMAIIEWKCKSKYKEANSILEKIYITETSYLQIRKIIELIMFISVCYHDASEIELSNKIRNGWNEDRLIKWLEKVNPEFFPVAIDLEESDEPDIEGIFVDATNIRSCLDRTSARDYYIKCGLLMHENRNGVNISDLDNINNDALEFFEKTMNLLYRFNLECKSANITLIGELNYKSKEGPKIFVGKISR